MEDYRTKLGINTSDYESGLDSAKKKTEQFQDTADKTGKSLKDLENKSRTAGQILKDISGSEQAAKGMTNYRSQLMKVTKQIQDLTITYRQMDDAMKNSDIGRETAAKIQELTEKASMYKDAINDVQQEITKLASDTAVWDGMRQGIDMVSSSLQAFAAAGILGQKSTDELVKVIAKLKGIEAATNAVIKIGNALQKNSALMASITTIQTKALARAKALETTATKGATAAQRVFNAVAKANPYVLLAAAIIAVGTALIAFAKHSKEATEAEKKHQEQLEKEKEKTDAWASTVGTKVGDVLAKYKLLQIEWGKLSTAHQKQQWIKQNQTEFNNLGLKINDVISAEKAFVSNTDAVVEALKKRAMVMAKQTQLTDLYRQLMEEQVRADAEYERLRKEYRQDYNEEISPRTQGNFGTRKIGQSHLNSRTGQRESGAYYYTEQGAANANKKIYAQTHANVQRIQGEIDKLAANIADELDLSSVLTSGTTTTTTLPVEIKPEAGSLAAAQKIVSELQQKLNNMSPDNPEFEKTKSELEAAKKTVEEIQEKLKTLVPEPDPLKDLVHGSLTEANYFVTSLTEQLKGMSPDNDEFQETLDLLNVWKKRQQEINNLINGTKEETAQVESNIDKIIREYNELTTSARNINELFKLGAISSSDAQKLLDDINKKLEALGVTVRVNLEINEYGEFKNKFDKITSAVTSPMNAIKNLGDTWNSMTEKLEDPDATPWEQFWAVFSMGESIISAVSTALSVMSTITELLTAAKTANATATAAETTATIADTAATEANTGAKIGEAAATGAVTATEAGESVASVPIAGPILAAAAILAILGVVLGVISSLSAFADGGIVNGHSYTGDKILARVNSGEMILNQKQQERLWDQMNRTQMIETQPLTGDVKFKIHGTDLVGVLNNYSTKQKHI